VGPASSSTNRPALFRLGRARCALPWRWSFGPTILRTGRDLIAAFLPSWPIRRRWDVVLGLGLGLSATSAGWFAGLWPRVHHLRAETGKRDAFVPVCMLITALSSPRAAPTVRSSQGAGRAGRRIGALPSRRRGNGCCRRSSNSTPPLPGPASFHPLPPLLPQEPRRGVMNGIALAAIYAQK